MIQRNKISGIPTASFTVRPAARLRTALAGTALGVAGFAFAAPLAVSAVMSLPELGIDTGPRLGIGNAASAGFSGTCSENLQTVLLGVRHSASGQRIEAPSVSCADGVWQVSGLDLSGLSDGPLLIDVEHNDLAGQRVVLSTSLVKGGVAPRVGINAPALIHTGNLESYALSGTCSEEGQKVALTLGDAQGHRVASASSLCAGQHWSTALSSLATLNDGIITATVSHSEISFGTANLSGQVLKNTSLPGLSIDPFLWVKSSNQAAFSLSGACSEAQQPVSLAVSDSHKVTIYGSALCSDKSWKLPALDLSSLSGGELRFVATHANATPVVRTVLQAGLKETSANSASSIAASASSRTAPSALASSGTATVASLLPAQSITFNSLGNKALGDLPFVVAATASSGLPVSFSSLTPQLCTSTGSQGSTISLLLLGTCTLEANQAGNTQTAAALPVAQSFTVGVATRDAMLGKPAIAAGGNHTIAIKGDALKSVWTWGDNERGQLGDGTTLMRSTPVQVPNLSADAVGAGASHSVALKTDGSIVAWGNNDFGQLGNGTASTANVTSPVTLSGTGLSVFSAIAVGAHHTLALTVGGDVWAWGANGDGQIGQAATTPFNAMPVKIASLAGVIAIAAGANHSLALKSDGTVVAWGRNTQGQLGNNATTGSVIPVQASILTGVTAIAAGGEHSLALKDNGVWAWGGNWAGQLGNSVSGNQLLPVALSNPSTNPNSSPAAGVKAIGAGNAYSLALKADGSVLAWGYGASGQTGSGSTQTNPITVMTGVSGITALAAGDNHVLVLKIDGTVLAWGYNGRGQLGDGSLSFRQEPVNTGMTSITTMTAGAYHLLSNTGATSSKVWGSNWRGQLADSSGFLASPTSAASVFTATGTTVVAGYGHTLTRLGGAVQALGGNWAGQLGDGSTTQRTSPVSVPNLSGLLALAAGGQHSLAIKADSTVAAWGGNDAGQLGNNSTTPSTSPVGVNTLSGATAVAAGYAHSVALKTGGTVWTWGSNLFGQLGDSGTANRAIPVSVSLSGAATQIATGLYHTLALVGGSVVAWGSNSAGQLGDGKSIDRNAPFQVPSLSGITKIAAGAHHSLAMNAAGQVWAWGRNDYGQLGDASLAYSRTPLLLAGVTAADIAAGFGYSAIRTSDGKLIIMGDGRDGELGLDSVANAFAIRPVPAAAMLNLVAGSAVSLSPVPSAPVALTQSFTATSSVAGKAYWVLQASFQRAPTLAEIKTGSGDTYAVVAASSGDIPAGGAGLAISPSNMAAGKAYRLFVCVVKTGDTNCTGNATSVDFMTAKAGNGASTYALGVTSSGPLGAGFVSSNVESSDGTAIYCPSVTTSSACSKTYTVGKIVTLLASSNSGATFTGWSGTGCSGASPTCTVSATATVTATFILSAPAGGTVLFPQANYTAVPGKTTTITIVRSGNIDNAASVNVVCGTGSPANCSLFPTSLSFVAGQSSKRFTVFVPASNTGSVQLTLSAGTGSPTIAGTGKMTVNLRKNANLTPILMLLLD